MALDQKSRLTSILAPISFVLSVIAVILVLPESKNFTQEHIKQKPTVMIGGPNNTSVLKTSKDDIALDKAEMQDVEPEIKNYKNNEKQSPQNHGNTNDNDISDIINDLETMNFSNKKGVMSSLKTSTEEKKAFTKNELRFKYFDDKDDAILELNRLRLKHKDLMARMNSSVKAFKVGGVVKYAIHGILLDKKGDPTELCNSFESRNVECHPI